MARVVITDLADADTADILEEITREAGHRIARKYNARIESLYERLADHPESCQARPKLGAHIRVGVVYPYLVIYRHVSGDDTVSIIRVVSGRRKLTRKLLHGA
jgi:toxin ParE1/3/4